MDLTLRTLADGRLNAPKQVIAVAAFAKEAIRNQLLLAVPGACAQQQHAGGPAGCDDSLGADAVREVAPPAAASPQAAPQQAPQQAPQLAAPLQEHACPPLGCSSVQGRVGVGSNTFASMRRSQGADSHGFAPIRPVHVRFFCKVCNMAFVQKDQLQKHATILHPRYVCRHCQRCFAEPQGASAHEKSCPRLYALCRICGWRALSYTQLEEHVCDPPEPTQDQGEQGAGLRRGGRTGRAAGRPFRGRGGRKWGRRRGALHSP